MTKIFISFVFAGLFLLITAALEEQTARAEPTTPACMAGSTTEGRSFTFPVPQSDISNLEGRGFVLTSCSADASVEEFISAICQLANTAPALVQQHFTVIYRISPAEMCALANAAASENNNG